MQKKNKNDNEHFEQQLQVCEWSDFEHKKYTAKAQQPILLRLLFGSKQQEGINIINHGCIKPFPISHQEALSAS